MGVELHWNVDNFSIFENFFYVVIIKIKNVSKKSEDFFFNYVIFNHLTDILGLT